MKPVLAGNNRGRGRRFASPKYLLSLMALVAVSAVAMLGTTASSASATTSYFCGGVLGNRAICEGAARTVLSEEVWGGTGGVCAAYTVEGSLVTASCVPNASEIAYGNFGSGYYTNPSIWNSLTSANDVQGFAYQP